MTTDKNFDLGFSIKASIAADDAFNAALLAAGIVSRWDLRGLPSDYPPAVKAAYFAKVAADDAMHVAFANSRKRG